MLYNSITPDQKRFFRKRIILSMSIFLFFLLLLLVQVAYIQVIQKNKYKRYSQGQAEQQISLKATRGRIYDRKGQLLVGNRPAYSLYIIPAYFPKKSKNKIARNRLLKYLSEKLNMTTQNIIKKITITDQRRQNKYFSVLIKRDLAAKVYSELVEIPKKYLPGVEIRVGFMRNYLLKDNLSQVIGYTGLISQKTWDILKGKYGKKSVNPYVEKSSIIGKRGIEKYQDLILRGEDGIAVRMVNSKGRPIPNSTEVIREARPGNELYLTIDTELQKISKKLMINKKGTIIVSKPHNGEILAFVSNPSFNPEDLISRDFDRINNISKDTDALLYNRMLQGHYPPSSIFKIIVAIAALENNISIDLKYKCRGLYYLGSRIFKCHTIHNTINMTQALEKSCNVYFFHLAQFIGWRKIYPFGKLFGLGEVIQLEIGKSWSGYFPNYAWKKKAFNEIWFPGDTLNHSIGQGYMLLPPIQVHKIISTIANNGIFQPFSLIQKIKNPLTKKNYYTSLASSKNLKLKKSSLLLLQKSLYKVTKTGTAKFYSSFLKIPLAGKTGTAQHIIGEPTHAWFTAYAPANHNKKVKDRISITVLVESTEGGGGFVAVPLAVALMRYYFNKISLCQSQIEMQRYLGCSPLEEKDFIVKNKNFSYQRNFHSIKIAKNSDISFRDLSLNVETSDFEQTIDYLSKLYSKQYFEHAEKISSNFSDFLNSLRLKSIFLKIPKINKKIVELKFTKKNNNKIKNNLFFSRKKRKLKSNEVKIEKKKNVENDNKIQKEVQNKIKKLKQKVAKQKQEKYLKKIQKEKAELKVKKLKKRQQEKENRRLKIAEQKRKRREKEIEKQLKNKKIEKSILKKKKNENPYERNKRIVPDNDSSKQKEDDRLRQMIEVEIKKLKDELISEEF